MTTYQQNLDECAKSSPFVSKLKDKTILISGATGMIGKYLIDLVMRQNEQQSLNCTIIALGRNAEKAKKRFPDCFENENFIFVESDINDNKINLPDRNIDYVIHAASNTHPLAYSTYPVSTIETNITGTNTMAKIAADHHARFIFLSSVEVYGENRGDVEKFDEKYLGYIDSNTLRAGYPESKRCGEALCQAYKQQYDLDVVIPRLSRVFGPTMLMSDTKASSQFIKNSLNNEDIVLKSEGNQYFSYLYVSDIVSAIIFCMINGVNGEAYNIASDKQNITLKELAETLAEIAGTKVVFDLPDESERKGYSTATKAILDASKLKELGWESVVPIKQRLEETIAILKEENE